MEKLLAYYNHASGWICDCPICNKEPLKDGRQKSRIAEQAIQGRNFICSCCYPGIYATKKEVKPNGQVVVTVDKPIRENAVAMAKANGDVYEIVFPADKEKIDKILGKRPTINRNWFPWETVEDLKKENKEHGIK